MNRIRVRKTDLAGTIVERGKGRCRVLLDSYDAPLWLYNDEIEPIPRVCAARKERRRAAFVPGTRLKYSGFEWIALEETDSGVLAVTAKCLTDTDGDLDEFPFDENDKNDWRKSSLRKYLNGEYLRAIDADSLIKQTLDLTAGDGMRDYGTSNDYVGILSCEQYRKYRDILPDYGCWWWTLTPWTCHASDSNLVRIVDTSGIVSNSGSASVACGVAPTLIIKAEVYNALQQEDQT